MNFEPNEYFLWKRKTDAKQPWLRQYLNQGFYKHEFKRINQLGPWYNKLRTSRTDENESLEECSFYAIPLELSTVWKASISEVGNYNFIGLSAIRNAPSYLIIGLLPYDTKRPEDYTLINVLKSRKKNLISKRNKIENAILIDDWEYLPSDKPYLDVPYQKNIVQKLIEENLGYDPIISQSLQSPIAGAPYVSGSVGGVSLASLTVNSDFAQELIKSVQMMVPPEYSHISPPRSAYNGTKFTLSQGIKFRLAERLFLNNRIVVGVYGNKYDIVTDQNIKRSIFNDEYSFFSTLENPEGAVSEIWKELLRRFTATDITLPRNLDELQDSDVDLKKFQRVINEDSWIQVAHMGQLQPSINAKSDQMWIKKIELLKKDIDVLLSDVHKNDIEREHVVRSMIRPLTSNMLRLSQSFSRSDNSDNLDEKYISQARNLTVGTLSEFIKSPEFEAIQLNMKKKKRDKRFEILETTIINNSKLSSIEIYEEVKPTNFFKDTEDLQGMLDWLHRKGFVIIDINKRYAWVGRLR